MNTPSATMKYVAFCDLLGFGDMVLKNFEDSLSVYQEFREAITKFEFKELFEKISVSIYSDSILIVGKELPQVLRAVNVLYMLILPKGFLIRGGIAYGRYWKEVENENVYVVSEAVVKAVRIEKDIKEPVIAIDKDIHLGLDYWALRFSQGIFIAPVLHYKDLTFVNPFNLYWLKSAQIWTQKLLEKYPEHKKKYEWFLALAEEVRKDEILIPEWALSKMLELGILEKDNQQ